MHTLFIKYYDAKYRIKSENYFFLSSQVFYIALFQAFLNWQIFANPENRGAIFIRGVNQKVFFSRSIAVLRHKTERNLGMKLQNTLFSVFLTMLYNE